MKKIILIIMAVLLMGCSAKPPVDEELIDNSNTVVEDNSLTETEDYSELVSLWYENKQINEDYIGEIWFDSNLVNESFVQGKTNDTYLRKDWKTGSKLSEGSIFLDSRNTLDDQNIIIYGHYVYLSKDPEGTHKFTSLRFLIEQENYQSNSTFHLLLVNEIRTYQIAYVYYCQLHEENGYQVTDEKTQYYHTQYEQEYFKTYIDAVKKQSFYDTGIELTYSDRFVTLQTCVENHDELREIVIAKEIDVIKLGS